MTNLSKNNSLDVAIIGAGPIGCYAAYLLSKNHKVTIYENHATVGSPIQCTGILTSDFDQFNIPTVPFLVNTISKIEVHSPSKSLTINQKDYIVCRTKFDQHLAQLAESAGATIHTNHSFQRKEGDSLIIKNKDKEITVSPDIVIAADGPLSPTAKAFNLYHKDRENFFGVQAVVEGTFEQDTIKTYFGNDVCPGLFAWVTPESKTTARIGLAMKKDSRKYFNKFIETHGFKVKEMQAGTIPLYHPKQILHKGNCYLIGDASSYVKATTLGGIVPAMQQVEIMVNCINNNKDYNKEIAPIRKKMWVHSKIQQVFEKFSDKDWDNLIEYVDQPKIKKVLEKYTRDNPIPLVTHALLKEPRFLLFAKYLF